MDKELLKLAESKMKLFPKNNNEMMDLVKENGYDSDIEYFKNLPKLGTMDDEELKDLIRKVNCIFELEDENEVLTEDEVVEKVCQILNDDYDYYVSNGGAAIISEYIIMRAELGDSVEDIVDTVVDEINLKAVVKN